jgi:lysophospholipase L1-like esterase
MTHARSILLHAGAVAAVAIASIAVALWVTPMQEVSAAGQTIEVGATAPSFSLSGPGQLDLFGQALPTRLHFDGPVRPRVRLTHITLSQQLAEFTGSGSGPKALEDALVRGWKHYFYWQLLIVALTSIVLAGALAGWLRRSLRTSALLVGTALTVTLALDLGAIMITAFTAPAKLSRVGSLQALVGRAPEFAGDTPPADPGPDPQIVVVGDSTAAGLGLRPVKHAAEADTACRRSTDSYAAALSRTNGWSVTNLACSGATIEQGLLGQQRAGSVTLPAQLDTRQAGDADVVLVSVGANDLHWTDILRACAVASSCNDRAARAYFQQQLAAFSSDYLQLLGRLQTLPNRPLVIVNLYYDPFVDDGDCLAGVGIDSGKIASLKTELDAMNSILEQGAKAASFATAHPDFGGHGVCSDEPYVQGLADPAPFHPTAAGELAIALTDENALHGRPGG